VILTRVSGTEPPANGEPAGERLVQHHAQAEDVGSGIDRLAPDLLRREVGRGAGDHVGTGEGGVFEVAGEAEVDDVGVERAARAPRHQDVAGLEVPVDEAGGVGGVDRARHGREQGHDLSPREAGDCLVETDAIDVLHRDVGVALDLARLEHLANVRVIDPRLGASFAQQALALIRFAAMEDLHRREAHQRGIEDLVDRSHAAGSESGDHLVAVPTVEDLEVAGDAAVLRPEGVGGGRGDGVGGSVLALCGQALESRAVEQALRYQRVEPGAGIDLAPCGGVGSGRTACGSLEVLPGDQAAGHREAQEPELSWAVHAVAVGAFRGRYLLPRELLGGAPGAAVEGVGEQAAGVGRGKMPSSSPSRATSAEPIRRLAISSATRRGARRARPGRRRGNRRSATRSSSSKGRSSSGSSDQGDVALGDHPDQAARPR
jgi:hypothetical protein